MYRHFGFAAALVVCAAAAPSVEQETKPASFSTDLNADGAVEKIETRFSGRKEQGKFYYLAVKDSEGNTIWTGPKDLDPANKLVFGEWDYGCSMPQLAGDVDGDGAIELIAPAPQSDVSPTTFRVMRWTGGAFEPVRETQLLERPAGSDKFPWKNSEEYLGTWISEFQKVSAPGECQVKVTQYKGGTEAREGVALVAADENGYHVKSWIKKLARSSGDEPSANDTQAAGQSPSSNAGKPLANYTCQLGEEDMRSSKGERLTKISEVLAQDRANYHRFKIRHRRDLDEESYFASATNRVLFERVPVRASEKAVQLIRQGNATVQVTAYADRIEVKVADE